MFSTLLCLLKFRLTWLFSGRETCYISARWKASLLFFFLEQLEVFSLPFRDFCELVHILLWVLCIVVVLASDILHVDNFWRSFFSSFSDLLAFCSSLLFLLMCWPAFYSLWDQMLPLFAMIFLITSFFKRSISTSCPSVVALFNSCVIFRSFFLSQTIDDPNIMGEYVLSQLLFKNGTVPLTTSGILRWGNHGNICLFFFFTTCINGGLGDRIQRGGALLRQWFVFWLRDTKIWRLD